jgi:hypothetical protein
MMAVDPPSIPVRRSRAATASISPEGTPILTAMANEPENLVLACLQRIDEKVDRLRDDVRELKTGLNGVRRDLIALAEADARVELMVDRQGERLDKIERRLDLRDS